MKAKEQEIKIISPKKLRREAEDRVPLKTVNEKSRVESSRNVRHSPVNGHVQLHQASQLTKANRQIEEQQKALD